jgi:hypothetical protein
MLIATGYPSLGIVLLVMVGDKRSGDAVAHWISTTEISSLKLSAAMDGSLWFAVFPTVKHLSLNCIAAVPGRWLLLYGDAFAAAGHWKARNPCKRREPRPMWRS